MLAAAARRQGQYPRAARLLGAAEVLREALGNPVSPAGSVLLLAEVAALLGDKPEPALLVEWARGRCMGYEQAVAYALELTLVTYDAFEPLESEMNGSRIHSAGHQ